MASVYFTEEHEQFREQARQFFAQSVDAEAWEASGRIPRAFWRKMGELGYLGINVAEAYGGAEADFFYSAVFLEELGRMGMGGLSAAVGVQQFMAHRHIELFGSDDLKQRFLAPSARGEKVGALAVSEPDAGSDVAAIRTRAVRDGDQYVVNGAKVFITNGVDGDFVTVAARTGSVEDRGGVSLLVVERDTPGFSARPMRKLGWHCSDTGELTFEDARVPAANLIGEEGQGFYYLMQCFQLERLVAALTAIGGADFCMETTLAYIKQRQAFGRPISKFQVLRHRLAELATELEAARQLTYHACWLHQRGELGARECSMAKLKAAELGVTIADACLQCFGGYGFMEEYPLARMYRDARGGTIAGGTSEIMKEIIAKIEIDGERYESTKDAAAGDAGAAGPELAEIFAGLPARFRGEPDQSMRVHFDFAEDDAGAYTVALADGQCTVAAGLTGEADCVVKTAGAVYRAIELGRTSPETAFMNGQIQVSDIPAMMAFIKSFKRLDDT